MEPLFSMIEARIKNYEAEKKRCQKEEEKMLEKQFKHEEQKTVIKPTGEVSLCVGRRRTVNETLKEVDEE